MGHEHHFLSRLDRVALPHVELALSLYRDHELIRALLSRVALPDRVDRVAISLDHPQEGPFLIVTREGRFVTCLAEGMKVDLPIVTRRQLDGIATRVEDLRTRAEMAKKLSGPSGETTKLLRRIYTAGPELSREEFVGISAFQPLLEREFLRLYIGSAVDLETVRERLQKVERPRPQLRPLLKSYWSTLWAMSHLAVLAMLDGRRLFDTLPPEMDPSHLDISWGALRHGIVAVALRGIWACAKAGKMVLPGYKDRFDQPLSYMRVVDACLGLGAIGARHAKLRAEIRKVMTIEDPPPASDDVAKKYETYILTLRKAMADTILAGFDEDGAATPYLAKRYAPLIVELGAGLPVGAAHRFERAEDVPVDLAMALGANRRAEFLNHPEMVLEMALHLPWLARAEPEQLYLPQELMRMLHRPWTPEMTLELLRPLREHYKTAPAPRPSGPARKDPCPCGSGKKYKRCCGA